MAKGQNKSRKALKRALAIIIGIVVVLAAVVFIYFGNYYHASSEATKVSQAAVEDEKGNLYFEADLAGECSDCAVVFYPGGKVEASAYAPLAQACAKRGISFAICRMPLNFAFFGSDAIDDVIAEHPEIKHWYLAGHSLGNVVGSMHVGEHPQDVEGIIYLASYTTEDLSGSGLKALSIYGSEDQVLSQDEYQKNAGNLPAGCIELIIEGGNHAGFGSYGAQKGDGVATISGDEQVSQTADAIVKLVKG